MAEIITLQSAIVPILQKAAQKISDRYDGIRADETNWMIHCPLHDDKQASCHIQVTDKLLVYCHVCGKDKQKDLIDTFKKEDLWVTIESSQKVDTHKGPRSNIPAHSVPSQFPQYLSHQGTNYPITKIWTYRTATGHPAFWVMRADFTDAIGKTQKIIKPFSSITENGVNKFKFTLQCDERPLYNLPFLLENPWHETIIIVEGEKTADAAQEWFTSCPVTTWHGGAKGFRNTDISPLLNKRVILWPDNDQTSIDAMVELSMRLKDPLIVFQEVQENLPRKWDLADPVPKDFHPLEMLQNAQPVKIKLEDVELDLDYYRSRLQKMEYNNDIVYVDMESRDFDRNPRQPFKIYGSLGAVYKAFPQHEVTFIDGKPHRSRSVDKYLEDPVQPVAHAITFDPTTTNKLIMRGKVLYINSFMGFEHEPKECDVALYQPFLDHVNGVLDDKCAEWLLDFFSDMVQNIGRKPGVMPILTGKPGTGKSIIGIVIECMLGKHVASCIQCGAVVDSKFNGVLSQKVFVTLDEINLYGAVNRHANEALKVLVTDKWFYSNEKYKVMTNELSYHRIIGTTNSNMPLFIDMSDRRFAVFHVSDRFLKNKEHFDRLVIMMKDPIAISGLHHYFMNREIKTSIHNAPETEARTLIQKPEDPVVSTVFTILNDAVLPEEIARRLIKSEWPQDSLFIPRHFLNDYVARKHPSLAGTRVTNTLLSYFKWDRIDGAYNNTRRATYNTSDGKGIEEIKERVYHLKPIDEQRKIYEQVTGTKPSWSEITFDEDEEPLDTSIIKEPF